MRPRHAATLAATTGLALAGGAAAHVVATPQRIPALETTRVVFVAREERPGRRTVSVSLHAPATLRLRAVSTTDGTVETSGQVVAWSRGSATTSSGGVPTVLVDVTAGPRAGLTQVRATQVYDDGARRRWDVALRVTPAIGADAPGQHLQRAVIVGVVGSALVAASLLVLRRFRRGPLQDR